MGVAPASQVQIGGTQPLLSNSVSGLFISAPRIRIPCGAPGAMKLGAGGLVVQAPLGRADEVAPCPVVAGAWRNRARLTFLGRLEPAERTDTRAPGCYNLCEALHAGSRLPSPWPANCRGDGLSAARSRNCRPASCPCDEHATGACARPAAICQPSPAIDSLAATCCPGSFAGYSFSCAPLLRRHRWMPLASKHSSKLRNEPSHRLQLTRGLHRREVGKLHQNSIR